MKSAVAADVLVIGGGIIGASIAWKLAGAGLSTVICDARGLGEEASWAGAGMLVPGSEFDEPNEWLAFGLESLRLYPEYVASIEEASGVSIDFARCGALELASSDAELDVLRKRAALQSTLGIETTDVPPSGLPASLRADLAGAIFYAGDGQVDPRTVMGGLRIALARSGVSIRTACPVVSVRFGSNVEALVASGDRIWAERAVLAAGAWSTGIEIAANLPQGFPVRGHLVGYQLAPNSLPHVLRFHHTYVVQRRSGYTIAGATEEQVGFDRTVDPVAAGALAAAAHNLVPGLLPQVAPDAWVGFRPGIQAAGPVMGRWGNSPLWLAYGHYRNGILFAPATAERIVREMVGDG